MADFNPEQFKQDNGNKMNPLMQPATAPKTANPLAGHFRQAKIYIKLPSGGQYYDEGSLDMPENQELPVMPMTAKDLTCKIRPLNYKEFSQVSMQTFEEQRIFALVNNDQIDEDEKLKQFNVTFNKIRDITLGMVISSVVSIQVGDEVVSDRNHITEFLENTDKSFFKSLSDHIEKQKKEFEVPPMEVRSTEEQLKEGAPETFEVPIVFDQAHFFA